MRLCFTCQVSLAITSLEELSVDCILKDLSRVGCVFADVQFVSENNDALLVRTACEVKTARTSAPLTSEFLLHMV